MIASKKPELVKKIKKKQQEKNDSGNINDVVRLNTKDKITIEITDENGNVKQTIKEEK